MRTVSHNIEDVKRRIEGLKGKSLALSVNKGRKKVVKLDGVIEDVFPSVFTFRDAGGDIASFSYSDVICGDIVLANVR